MACSRNYLAIVLSIILLLEVGDVLLSHHLLLGVHLSCVLFGASLTAIFRYLLLHHLHKRTERRCDRASVEKLALDTKCEKFTFILGG